MRVQVKLYAAARHLAGANSLAVDLPESATVADLRAAIGDAYPQLVALLRSSRFAMEAQYVGETVAVTADAEIALIPPVSGG